MPTLKKKGFQINRLTLYLKKLQKEQNKPRASKWK